MMMGRRAMVVLCAVAEAARVVTPDGPVVGFAKGGFDAFLGLPFAAPPVGDLRFRAPQRPANWTADRPAVTMGASCLQPGSRAVGGSKGWPSIDVDDSSEDCLLLTSGLRRTADAAPVLVYLHSGEFRYGSANDVESRWPSFGAGGDSEPVAQAREKNATLKWTALPSSLSAAEAGAAAREACEQDDRCFATFVRSDAGSGEWVAELFGGKLASSVALRRYGGTTSDFADVRRPDGASFAACLRSADAADLVRAAGARLWGHVQDDAVAPFVDGRCSRSR
ncbi:carboxylic ester hydrolase [Aureococcus anophagefferens]|nr:carboxylic ester hydrolase [Aureococcus anophagefferens]